MKRAATDGKAMIKKQKSSFETSLEQHAQTSKQSNYERTWTRSFVEANELRSGSHHSLSMQQIEVEDVVIDNEQMVRIYGISQRGTSIMVNVSGFLPYIYVPAPNGFTSSHLKEYRSALEEELQQKSKSKGVAVQSVEICKRNSIFGYQGKDVSMFLKVTVRLQVMVPQMKRIFKDGFSVPGLGHISCHQTYESNIPFTLRFMIDAKIKGMTWVTINNFEIVEERRCVSMCQIELKVKFENLEAHDAEGEYIKIAPLRILSFDIECCGRKGIFPEAEVDPVIQIANIITIQGESKPIVRNVFTLGGCSHIVGADTISFESEDEMLMKWLDFVLKTDPDIIIGYNINGFDLPYLLTRAKTLNLKQFPFLGRIKGLETVAKDAMFSSKAFGTRNSKAINIDGRIQIDVLTLMQRDHKLRSYTLNSVSAHFLGEQKEDVHHSIIADLQNGDDETRRRLAVYCLKDAYLPQRLLDKLMCVINYVEMARVTGVNFSWLLTRGQQIKVVSQLYRKAKEVDLVIPAMDIEGTDEQYEGAIVIEPEKGYYQIPIATLDFTSLYPSIMMAHNLCYSTYLRDRSHAESFGLKEGVDYVMTPNRDLFLKTEVKKGLLPTILEDLLTARSKAKADLKKETDPFKRAVLDGRQLALKISANSVYGFTGATIGKLPLLAISSSTTAYGREMIIRTKELVEQQFTTLNGYQNDAKVIYGDTDSVMVKFGVKTVQEAMDLGKEAAKFVTKDFKKPINLDFEKVYFPYLLINKKRYAGLYWTNPNHHDKMDAKGIETVRRDSCRLVSNVIETCLKKLLIDRDREGAEEYVKMTIADLLQNKVDLSLLVISKALGKAEYAGKQAHSELADRMRKRDAGTAPALGDRVSYVIIQGTKSKNNNLTTRCCCLREG